MTSSVHSLNGVEVRVRPPDALRDVIDCECVGPSDTVCDDLGSVGTVSSDATDVRC